MSPVHTSAVVVCAACALGYVLSLLFPSLSSRPPLLEAAFIGDAQRVIRIIAESSNQSDAASAVQVRDHWNNTALHWAVKDAHPDTPLIIDALTSAGVDVRSVNAAGSGVLHWSVHSDDAAIMTAIMDKMCRAWQQRYSDGENQQPPADCPASLLFHLNDRNESALHWAVDWQKPNAVRSLLRRLRHITATHTPASAAQPASLIPSPSSSVPSSLAAAIVNQPDVNGDTPLHRIPLTCDHSASCRRIVKDLLRCGANITAENAARRTPLQHFNTATARNSGTQQDGEEEEEDWVDGGVLSSLLDEKAEEFRRNLTEQFHTV